MKIAVFTVTLAIVSGCAESQRRPQFEAAEACRLESSGIWRCRLSDAVCYRRGTNVSCLPLATSK